MDTRKIKDFFFQAMNNGWVVHVPKTLIPNMPGSKSIQFHMGEYSLLDYYFVSPISNASYGTTIIWIAEKPVWVMHYGGWYKEQAIPFLKRALRRNYENYLFVGGRGPIMLEGENHTMQYLNDVEQNDFSDFGGHEQIITTSSQLGIPVGQKLGKHRYFGGAL